MNEIYVLVTGEYSDWEIKGYVTSEEEAIKNCKLYNKNITFSHNEMYYIASTEFNEFSRSRLEEVNYLYEHSFRAYKEGENWQFVDPKKFSVKPTEIDWTKIEFYDFHAKASIIVCLREVNREKALKIAQDMLYKKLAEEEGL